MKTICIIGVCVCTALAVFGANYIQKRRIEAR